MSEEADWQSAAGCHPGCHPAVLCAGV